MNIIIILLCFGIDKFLPSAQQIRSYRWLTCYWEYLYRHLFANHRAHPIAIISSALLPLLVIAAIIQYFLGSVFHGIFGFLFNLVVLFYCLGPINLREQFENYFSGKERGDYQGAYDSLQNSSGEFANIENVEALTKSMNRHLLIQANQQIVAILFGFLLFGAFGALLYRLSLQLNLYCRELNSSYQGITPLMDEFVGWLNWIPARLTAMCYALAGNFVNSFSVLLRYLFDLPPSNEILLVDCGLAALNNSSETGTTTSNTLIDEQAVIDLIERVLVIILVSVALMTLGAWIS